MNNFYISTFYTKDSPYSEAVLEYLQMSLLHLPCAIHLINNEIEDLGSWYRNVAEKPRVVLQMLEENPKECLVFLDADCTVNKYPYLFHEIPDEYDLAFHTLNWNTWYGYTALNPVTELLTGTMFFRPNDKVKQLCVDWYEEAKRTSEWEQKVLERVIKHHDVKVYPLPIEYCYMATRPRGEAPLVKCDPVITHYQVSRTEKRRKR